MASAGTPSRTAKWRARVSTNPFGDERSLAPADTDICSMGDAPAQSHVYTSTATAESKEERSDSSDDSPQWRDSTAFLQDIAQHKPSIGSGADANPFVVHGKENLAPSRRNIHIYERPGVTTPRAKTAAARASSVRPPRAPVTPSKAPDTSSSEPFSVLGKRQFEIHSRVRTPRKQSPRRSSADSGASDPPVDSASTGPVTMVVNDFASVPHLSFGRVAISDRKTLQLTLANPSNLGNARIKYDGYARESHRSSSHDKLRFKCDLHVCVVPAESSVLLRITFEPHDDDLEREVAATLRFTVNDRYKLTCHVSGYGVARAHKKSRFARGHGAFALPGASVSAPPASQDGVLEISSKPDDASASTRAAADDKAKRQALTRRAESLAGLKRRESEALVLDMTPPRRPRTKRHRTDHSTSAATGGPTQLGTPSKATSGGFAGSWWSQRKVVYDEHWMVKQEEGFTKWMNYVLLDANAPQLVDGDALEPAAPLRSGATRRRFDFSSLRVLAQKRIESAWTRAAHEIYHAPAMEAIVLDLEDEIARKKLVCRSDRPVYADVGLQEELIALLNNYHPVWLRLGLEAVLGQRVMRDERCSLRAMFAVTATASASRPKMPRALRRVILQHVVHDTHVARKFRLVKNLKAPMDGSLAPSDVRAAGRNVFVNTKTRVTGREYFDALTESFVRKFLMLVKFLDAAIARRRDAFLHFPCLFRVAAPAAAADCDAPIKRSHDVVAAFCRLFLASEGRIDKHLRHLGYVLSHEQTPLDEVDVEIKNLAVDLRDGVRLAKLMDALTTSSASTTPSLASYLRVPALSRLQKVHNVELCLHFLQETCGHDVLASIKRATSVASTARGFARLAHDVDAKAVAQVAKDIVDGHREKTLALLWQVISCFQLQSLVDATVLQREIAGIHQRMSYRALEFLEAQERGTHALTSPDDVYALLLAWCRAVCANYAVAVRDFTTSFADGRALCYLLHYYHPMLLAKSDIRATTVDPRTGDEPPPQLLANEARHFALVNDCVKQLGDVPVLMPQHYDSQSPPEEKMVVTFVCYLQSRLMDSSREIHAASRLKRWWRSPYVRTQLRIKRHRSARVLQRFWFTSSRKRLAIRQCRRLLRAAHVVKSVLRMWSARVAFTRCRDAATVLQRAWRLQRLQTRRSKQLCERAAVAIQRHWRQYVHERAERQKREIAAARARIARRLRMKASGAAIAQWWRAVVARRAARAQRKRLIAERSAASATLQRAWRHAKARRAARTLRQAVWEYEHASATAVQHQWRAHRLRQTLARRVVVRTCAVRLTRALRQFAHKRQRERAAAVARFQQVLQLQERERRRAALQRRVHTRAAVQIQCAFRAHRKYQTRVVVAAAVTIQSVVRMCQQRARFEAHVALVVRLQRTVRIWRRNAHVRALLRFGALVDQYRAQRAVQCSRAAVRIQAAVRRVQQQRAFCARRAAAVVLQRNVRIWRRQRLVQALITFYDMLITYQHMRADALEHNAAARIQAAVRGACQRQVFAYLRRQAVLIQRAVRVWRRNRQLRALERDRRRRAERLARLQWRTATRAASAIQRAVRSFVARKRVAAAVRIQAVARGWCARRTRLDFAKLQAQLARLRVFTACWTLEWWFARAMAQRKQRTASARAIATTWRAHRLRRVVAQKIQERRVREAAAARERAAAAAKAEAERIHRELEAAAEAKRLEALRIQREEEAAEARRREEAERIQRELEAAAEAKRREDARIRREQEAAEARRLEELRVARERAAAEATELARLQEAQRQQRAIEEAAAEALYQSELRQRASVERVQSWWRGARVRRRLRRAKASTSALVPAPRVASAPATAVAPSEPPLTLGARLEMALHLLLHGKRLQEMLFASHTIEVCTKYSRECCRRCVKLAIPTTIFAAIRGLNRSRPHVELLHQLLRVLENLTTYQRWDRATALPGTRLDKTPASVLADARAIEALVDLLHIHRDMPSVFALAATVLEFYVADMRLHKHAFARSASAVELWRDAEKRLRGLYDLVEKRAAVFAAVASAAKYLPAASRAAAGAGRANPKAALAILRRVLAVADGPERVTQSA